MDTLEKLTQDESGRLYRADGRVLSPEYAVTIGKIRTLTVANPCFDISRVINKMVEEKSFFIPDGATAYVASDFSGDTQHLKKSNFDLGISSDGLYSVYAVQFYEIW